MLRLHTNNLIQSSIQSNIQPYLFQHLFCHITDNLFIHCMHISPTILLTMTLESRPMSQKNIYPSHTYAISNSNFQFILYCIIMFYTAKLNLTHDMAIPSKLTIPSHQIKFTLTHPPLKVTC